MKRVVRPGPKKDYGPNGGGFIGTPTCAWQESQPIGRRRGEQPEAWVNVGYGEVAPALGLGWHGRFNGLLGWLFRCVEFLRNTRARRNATVSTTCRMKREHRPPALAFIGINASGRTCTARPRDHVSKVDNAARCGARTRPGTPCKAPAMPNGRCRMHGGTSPGAPKGNKNALRHGHYSAEAISRRRRLAALIRASRSLSREV